MSYSSSSEVILPHNRRKTVTRSFRLDGQALEALEEEANRRNMSVNTLLNQQLLSYANFERFFNKLGLIKISSATFQKLLDAAADTEVKKAGEAAAIDTASSIIRSMNGEITLDTTLEYLQMLSEYSSQFEYSESRSPTGRMITLFHRLGLKGSDFYGAYVKTLFEAIGYSPEIMINEHSVNFEIRISSDIQSKDSLAL